MAGKGKGDVGYKLEGQIAGLKYTIFCFNIIAWMMAASLFGLTIWLRSEPGFEEWVSMLEIYQFYIGVYILLATSIIVMVVSFLGCASALMENEIALIAFAGSQVLSFLCGIIGTAILMNYSTRDSSLQELIHRTMTRLIMTSDYPPSSQTLKLIQENIGCCGAQGPNDYMLLQQPLPIECRDTVTGNAFFNGCVQELTWFMEDKSTWTAILTMVLVLVNTINCVLSIVLVQALRKEEKDALRYQR